METFEVVMIGNTAVGKTSMLSALANELDAYNLSGNVALEPTTSEFKELQHQWNKMVERVEESAPFTTLTEGIEGTKMDFIPHEFKFQVDGDDQARVLFTDTRGGMTNDLDERLLAKVGEAFGVFCVVDASILMECPASKNEKYNCPQFVKKLLGEIYRKNGGSKPRFVSFILTKCEKYMASAMGRRELADKFHEKYDNIVDMLRRSNCPPKTYLLAIQTMGCVTFFKLDNDGWPEFRILPKKEIKTKDCAYPLVILLRNLIEALDSETGFWDWVKKVFGLKKDLRRYYNELDTRVDIPELYEEL